jgi:hypothetical protein
MYQRVSIPPGRHVYNVPPRQKPRVAGQTYFLVAAYKPERSYVPSLLGGPFVLKQVSEQEAGTLVAQMTEKIGGTLEPADDEDEGAASVTSTHDAPAPNQSPGVCKTATIRNSGRNLSMNRGDSQWRSFRGDPVEPECSRLSGSSASRRCLTSLGRRRSDSNVSEGYFFCSIARFLNRRGPGAGFQEACVCWLWPNSSYRPVCAP